MSQRCIPALRSARGRIINMGSLGGEKPWATHAHYCSSKAALHMLTQVMAKSLAPEIAVNCVAPGMIDAGEDEKDPALLQRLAGRTPMKKNGTAQDVVSAVMYFATAPALHYRADAYRRWRPGPELVDPVRRMLALRLPLAYKRFHHNRSRVFSQRNHGFQCRRIRSAAGLCCPAVNQRKHSHVAAAGIHHQQQAAGSAKMPCSPDGCLPAPRLVRLPLSML